MDIDQQISEIGSRHMKAMLAETVKIQTEHYQAMFPDIKITTVHVSNKAQAVNDYQLKWSHDEYLNGRFEWNVQPRVDFLPVFADIIRRFEDRNHKEHGYQYRIVQGLYIDYAKPSQLRQGWSINEHDLIGLLKQADKLPLEGNNPKKGFRAWLLTRSYVCDDKGALGTCFLNWDHHYEFQKLLSQYESERNN